MLLHLRFWLLVIILIGLSITDMKVTLIGVEKGILWELNPFIAYYFLNNPTFAILVKALVPLFVSLYLYHRLGLGRETIFVFRKRFFCISSFYRALSNEGFFFKKD